MSLLWGERRYLPMAILGILSLPSIATAQSSALLCKDGVGSFDAMSVTKVEVHVGAAKKGPLAVRSCEATLSWSDGELPVATEIPGLDLDAFGVDLGLGSLVAAFQLEKSAEDCCMTYQIYSLQRPPKLLRTLSGGSAYSAADTDMDGRVEIWTNDASAVVDADGLTSAELDSPPLMVLRFEKGKLLDVSPEFVGEFDKRIARLRSVLTAQDLQDFKSSDGHLLKLDASSADQLHRLRLAKAKVLEIGWLFLYSGREPEAWRSLAEMWPAGDLNRIREQVSRVRSKGMFSQLDGVSGRDEKKKKTVAIFHPTPPAPQAVQKSAGRPPELDGGQVSDPVAAAVPILARAIIPDETASQALMHGDISVELVIDSAGKVRSASPSGPLGNMDLMSAFADWKFVPAYRGQHPVASGMESILSVQR